MHNLLGLVVHLHLFLGVAVVLEHVNLRDEVEGELVGELVDRHFFAGQHLAVLLIKLVHGGLTCAARCLVRADVDALDVAELLKSFERYNHHDGGAVGVGDDAARSYEGVLSVAFGHNKGYIFVHAEGRRIVNHHSAVAGDVFCVLLGNACAGRGEGDVYAFEIVAVLEEFYGVFLAAEHVFSTGAALRTEEQKFVDGEFALGQDAKKFLAYGTTGAYNCYSHIF